METRQRNQSQLQGSVLATTLFMACLIGVFLFSYLALTHHQRLLVARASAWNAALGTAEAGVEEALAQLNPGAPQPVIDLTANGWGTPVNNLYGPMSRSMTNGSYSVVYTADPYPIIYSTGYVTIPALSARLKRVLQVMTTNTPLFTAGMACRSNINFNGNGIMTDSFKSSNPNLSNNGRYPVGDPSKTSTNGNVATIFGFANVGNANIHGKLLLGPTGSDYVGANGFVTGGIYHDFNVEFEDVVLPQTAWMSVQALSSPIYVGGVLYNYVFATGIALGSGDYLISNLSGNIYVGPNTNVRLKVLGNASPGQIVVGGSGISSGKLTIYMLGPTFTLSGASVVDGGYASSLAYYGLPTNTRLIFGANADFTGTIYAPQAAFALGGGGNTDYNFVGSWFVNNIKMNGHYSFHYDEALQKAGPKRGFIAASWKEL